MRRRWKPITAGFLIVLPTFVYLNNTSRFSAPRTGVPIILAHRGLGQRYDVPIESNTCTAVHMLRPEHEYLENTISSMRAAFDRGADVVELDIQPTRDQQFAVFHDRSLECRTNGRGRVRAHTMDELKALDIGYGYTFDGGRTYPFRGMGVGLMPAMDEVLEKFPNRSFLLDMKGNEPGDAALLATHLSRLSPEQRSKLMIFGRGAMLSTLREKLPDLRMFSPGSVANCLLRYIAYGWTGIVPAACRNSPEWIPINAAPWLWGWPNLFLNRMEATHTFVIVMGAYPAHEISPGVDTLEDSDRLPADYDGGIWTNEVERISSHLRHTAGP